jgi:hypothetical protein
MCGASTAPGAQLVCAADGCAVAWHYAKTGRLFFHLSTPLWHRGNFCADLPHILLRWGPPFLSGGPTTGL